MPLGGRPLSSRQARWLEIFDDYDGQDPAVGDGLVDIQKVAGLMTVPLLRHRQRTLLKNAWVRSCFGLSKMSAGTPSSTMRPWSMNRTRSETSRANPIS